MIKICDFRKNKLTIFNLIDTKICSILYAPLFNTHFLQ